MNLPVGFTKTIKIRFADCDSAGIMFYPNAFRITNELVEDWFETVAEMPFSRMHLEERVGVPTVKVDAEFVTPCRLDERIDIVLECTAMGRSSLDTRLTASCEGQVRFIVQPRLVFIDLDRMKSIPVPHWASSMQSTAK